MTAPHGAELAQAVTLLRAGELVAFPTETVYGLGADAANPAAIRKIFDAKGRPADHPLIVHLPDASHLDRWAAEVPAQARVLADRFWPGPLTLILRRAPDVPREVTGGQDTIGLRVPSHPVALALLAAFDGGIAAPSANRFGRISATTAAHVRDEFGEAVSLVLDGGPCDVGIESTIVDLSRGTPVVLRPGAIGRPELAEALGTPVAGMKTTTTDVPRVPGALESHYAPSTPMRLLARDLLDAQLADLAATSAVVGVFAHGPCPDIATAMWIEAPDDARAYARRLYAALRELDAVRPVVILVERPPDTPEWAAILDRLQRASHP